MSESNNNQKELTGEQKGRLDNANKAWNEARSKYESLLAQKGADDQEVKNLLRAFQEADDELEAAKSDAGIQQSDAEKVQRKSFWDKLFGGSKDQVKGDSQNSGAKPEEPKKKAAPKKRSPKKSAGPTDNSVYVALRVYAGIQLGQTISKEIARSEAGNVLNENQLVKLKHGTQEWLNYLAQMVNSSWIKATVEKATKNGKSLSAGDVEAIQKEVDAAFGITDAKAEKKRELDLLKAKIAQMEQDI